MIFELFNNLIKLKFFFSCNSWYGFKNINKKEISQIPTNAANKEAHFQKVQENRSLNFVKEYNNNNNILKIELNY